MAMIASHRFYFDPVAEMGKEVGSQNQKPCTRQRYEQHSKSERIQGRFTPEDENKIHKRLDEK